VKEKVKKVFLNIGWYLQLMRWPNLVIIAVMQYFVRYNLIAGVYDLHNVALQTGDLDFALLVLSTLLIVAAGYIINDYFDIRIDIVNRPEKVLLFKRIPLRRSVRLYYALTILGCLLGIFVAFRVGSFKLGFIPVVMSIVLWYYSLRYKRIRFAGNFAVAALAAVTLCMVWLFEFYALKQNALMFADMIGYFGEINTYVFGYAIFAFLVSLIREMVKDIEDIEADRSFRCRTLPIVYGLAFTRRLIMVLAILSVAFTAFVIYKLFAADMLLVAWYFIVVIGLLWCYFLVLLVRAKEKKDYDFLSTVLKILIVAGVLSMQLLYLNF
jgi:4-hydroxybenzoate polyprenyltransferase